MANLRLVVFGKTGHFHDSIAANTVPAHGLPRHMHDTEKSGVTLKLVWLERCHPGARIVADVLSVAGFPDFGKPATGTGPAGMPSGDNVK
ncbi:TPA: hypothetical protein ACIUGV_004915 [Salmonella enterica subsp. enterica serovar Bahrenfeld]